jgi:hypothetical protein
LGTNKDRLAANCSTDWLSARWMCWWSQYPNIIQKPNRCCLNIRVCLHNGIACRIGLPAHMRLSAHR